MGVPPLRGVGLPPGSAIRLVAGPPESPSARVGRQSRYGGTTPVHLTRGIGNLVSQLSNCASCVLSRFARSSCAGIAN
jgi:hypothetical protein